jgi:hypothetical protein
MGIRRWNSDMSRRIYWEPRISAHLHHARPLLRPSMNNLIRNFICASLAVLCVQPASAQTSTEQYAMCSGYYFTLSFATPKFVSDLTEKQAKQAAFAMLKKVDSNIASPKAQEILINNWTQLDGELPKPYTQDAISTFREKYDGICRSLLKQAWCDAYGELDQRACAN